MKLIIQPFGYVEERVLRHLQKGLTPYFDEVMINEEIPIPEESFNTYREQFLVDDFMNLLRDLKGDKILGVVDRDLYTPEMNFVFGQGRIHGKQSIIALDRLHAGSTRKVFLQRVLKEAIHELGHTWGLRHCSNKLCVMHFSNTLDETDVMTTGYCKSCVKLRD